MIINKAARQRQSYKGDRVVFWLSWQGKFIVFPSLFPNDKELILVKKLPYIVVPVLLLFYAGMLHAQTAGKQYNISIRNGLPSNKVYYVLEDRHGYMWIATPKGVVQYNGYTPRLYGLEDGMSNDDVWELYEDAKGRIWAASIANEIGYIYNNKFKKVVAPGNNNTLYPRDIREYPGGVMFYSTYVTKDGAMCIEKNDTIRTFDLEGYFFPFFMPMGYGAVMVSHHNNIYKIALDSNLGVNISKICGLTGQIPATDLVKTFENYYLAYQVNGHEVKAFDVENCTLKKIDVNYLSKGDEKIKLISFRKKGGRFFYIITDKNVYKINNLLQCMKVMPIKGLADEPDIDGNKIVAVLDDAFWGQCAATSTKGLFLTSKSQYTLEPVNIYLPDFKYIGTSGSYQSYWWDDLKGTMVSIDSNWKMSNIPGSYSNVIKLVAYNKDSSFLLANNEINVFNNKTNKIIDRYTGYDNASTYAAPIDIAVKTPSNLYFLSRKLGVFHCRPKNGKIESTCIDYDRYQGIFYDKYARTRWIYNNKKILLRYNRKNIIINKEVLDNLGISKIEYIAADSFGNVFIKADSRLVLWNYRSSTAKVLFNNYVFDGAIVALRDDKLILAGKFGLLFSAINGPMQVSKPLAYHNVKNLNYSYVYDMTLYRQKVLLNTDKGFFTAPIPDNETIQNLHTDVFERNYKFVLSYNDSLYDVNDNDTIQIDQKNTSLFADIINPEGCGKLKFEYRLNDIDAKFQKLNANELHLPYLEPGKYYSLSFLAYDDVWRGNPLNIHLYIVPRWWQQLFWKRIALFGSIVILVLLVFAVAYVTNRVVSAQNARRNLRLKLELNSIYSQINPHFVFNSLSTALYFIKKKQLNEAQVHITKFSKLLRAYIKFSRKRYITIAEEAENLRNYIELQQARFEDKFDYEIVVDEKIAQTTTSIPALLLQPIVENAIVHGLLPMERKGRLNIIFGKGYNNDSISCVIEDDGIGREKAKRLSDASVLKTESYGDILVKDLVAIFNKYDKMNISITYEDKQSPEQGTIVKVTIGNPHVGQEV